MHLEIKKAELVQNSYGNNDIKVSMIGLYDDNGKYVKFIKLDETTLQYLLENKIPLSPKLLPND